MAIDAATETDTVSSTETSDNAVGDQSSQTDNSSQATGDVQSAPQIAADGSIANAEALKAGSSTKPDTTSHTSETGVPQAAPAAAAPIDWQARTAQLQEQYKRLQAGYTQGQQQLKQFQGVDPDAVAAFKKQQEAAAQAALKIWHPKNPQNTQFAGTRAKLDAYRSQIQAAATPEARAAIEATASTLFTPQERESIREWEGHKAQVMDRFASDPDSFIEELLEKKLQSTIDNRFQTLSREQQATEDVQRWMNAPANIPIRDKYAPEMMQALKDNVPWPYVRQMAMDRFKLEGAQSREGQVDQKAAMAKAQIQAQQKNASIQRDGKATPKTNVARQVFEMGKKGKWALNDPRYLTETARLTKLLEQQ